MPREERTSGPVAPEITLQADIGGITVAIVELVSGKTAEQIDERLDTYRRAIERQRAFNSLTEALIDLQARVASLALWPDRQREALKGRVDERVRLVASFEAAAQVGRARRVEGRTRQEQQAIDDFDLKTEEGRVKLDHERGQLEREIPVCEAQVARQRAIIAGRDRVEIMSAEIERARTAEAAD